MQRQPKKLDDEVDDLFKLPLTEFTTARNALAAELKRGGRTNEASLVKALAKPSISAWTVNQLYWNHRDKFDKLLAAGQRLHRLQSSGLAGKVADMRASLDARRETLSHLSDLATSLLREAGHNPTLDTVRRVTTTLEALSSYASIEDGPIPGCLTQDVDPPGFESLGSMIPSARATRATQELPRTSPSQKSAITKARDEAQKSRQVEETRRTKIAAAKVSLQTAKKLLAEARAQLQRLEPAQKKASTEEKEAEKDKREAEDRLRRARAVSEEATRRARSIAEEARGAAKAVEESNRAVAKATKELEALFRESSD